MLFAFYLAIVAALHVPGLESGMIYDSKGGIEDKAQVFASQDMREILGMNPGRPIFTLTLYANFLLTGMDPQFFRLATMVILAGTGLLIAFLYVLISRTPLNMEPRTDRERWIVGAVVGLLFVIHPLQIFVVEYVWQRQALLANFFSVAALAVYVDARLGRFQRPVLAYIASGMLFLAALLTKESAINVPSMLFLAELFLLRVDARQVGYRLVTIGLMCIPVLAIYGMVNHSLQGPTTVHTKGVLNLLLDNYRMAQLTVLEVIETQCRVLWFYFRMIVAPFSGSFPLVEAEIVSRSLWHPPATAAAVVGAIGLVGLGIGLARKKPLAAFGILFFVVTAIPEGVLSPQYLFFGYRPVLFMIGLLFVFGEVMDAVFFRVREKRLSHAVTIGLTLWAICLAGTTVYQSSRWSPMEFWQTAFNQLPPYSADTEQKAYEDVLINYGDQLMRAGRLPEAIDALRKAVHINPLYDLAQTKLASALRENGSTEEAIKTYRKAVAMNPRSPVLLADLGEALVKEGKTDEGIKALQEAVALDQHGGAAPVKLGRALLHAGKIQEAVKTLQNAATARPSNAAAHFLLGIALKRLDKTAEAIEHFRAALRRDPGLTFAHTALGLALESEGKVLEAQQSFRKALELDPRSSDAYYNLANCLIKTGNLEESIANFNRALERRPDFPQAHANLGTVLLRTGRVAEAKAHLEKALPHMPNNAELYNALGAALAEQGMVDEAAERFKKALEIDPSHPAARQNLEQLPHARPGR